MGWLHGQGVGEQKDQEIHVPTPAEIESLPGIQVATSLMKRKVRNECLPNLDHIPERLEAFDQHGEPLFNYGQRVFVTAGGGAKVMGRVPTWVFEAVREVADLARGCGAIEMGGRLCGRKTTNLKDHATKIVACQGGQEALGKAVEAMKFVARNYGIDENSCKLLIHDTEHQRPHQGGHVIALGRHRDSRWRSENLRVVGVSSAKEVVLESFCSRGGVNKKGITNFSAKHQTVIIDGQEHHAGGVLLRRTLIIPSGGYAYGMTSFDNGIEHAAVVRDDINNVVVGALVHTHTVPSSTAVTFVIAGHSEAIARGEEMPTLSIVGDDEPLYNLPAGRPPFTTKDGLDVARSDDAVAADAADAREAGDSQTLWALWGRKCVLCTSRGARWATPEDVRLLWPTHCGKCRLQEMMPIHGFCRGPPTGGDCPRGYPAFFLSGRCTLCEYGYCQGPLSGESCPNGNIAIADHHRCGRCEYGDCKGPADGVECPNGNIATTSGGNNGKCDRCTFGDCKGPADGVECPNKSIATVHGGINGKCGRCTFGQIGRASCRERV